MYQKYKTFIKFSKRIHALAKCYVSWIMISTQSNHSFVILQLLIRFTESIFICLILIHSWLKKTKIEMNNKKHQKRKQIPPPQKKTSLMFFLTQQKAVCLSSILSSILLLIVFILSIYSIYKMGQISVICNIYLCLLTYWQIFMIFKNKISTWISAWRGLKKKIYFVCIHGEFLFFTISKGKFFDYLHSDKIIV